MPRNLLVEAAQKQEQKGEEEKEEKGIQ